MLELLCNCCVVKTSLRLAECIGDNRVTREQNPWSATYLARYSASLTGTIDGGKAEHQQSSAIRSQHCQVTKYSPTARKHETKRPAFA
jgi:hypothetical protein